LNLPANVNKIQILINFKHFNLSGILSSQITTSANFYLIKFEAIDPISGHPNSDDSNGQFVSNVCWRKKSSMLVAANSVGIVKILQMV